MIPLSPNRKNPNLPSSSDSKSPWTSSSKSLSGMSSTSFPRTKNSPNPSCLKWNSSIQGSGHRCLPLRANYLPLSVTLQQHRTSWRTWTSRWRSICREGTIRRRGSTWSWFMSLRRGRFGVFWRRWTWMGRWILWSRVRTGLRWK